MNPNNIVAVSTVLSVLLGSGVLAAFVNKSIPKHTQLLEIVQDIQEERTNDRAKIEKLETRMEMMESKQKIRDDYIAALRMHINDGLPPPPPEWPPSLLQ